MQDKATHHASSQPMPRQQPRRVKSITKDVVGLHRAQMPIVGINAEYPRRERVFENGSRVQEVCINAIPVSAIRWFLVRARRSICRDWYASRASVCRMTTTGRRSGMPRHLEGRCQDRHGKPGCRHKSEWYRYPFTGQKRDGEYCVAICRVRTGRTRCSSRLSLSDTISDSHTAEADPSQE